MNNYTKSQRGCLIALLVFCVATPLLIYHCASRALEAEATYGAEEDVLRIATAYLENNPEWPKSWEDLEPAIMKYDWHPNPVPSRDEFDEFKRRVYIDFSLTRDDVAAMTVGNFTAIRPMGSCWPPYHDIVRLLRAARQDDGCTVLEALTIYLRNHAEWPKAWTDLGDTRLPLELGGSYLCSYFLDQWKKRVFVNFGTTRARVAAMTVENFTAVRPFRRIYGPREQRIRELLEVARQPPEILPAKDSKPPSRD